MAEGRRVRQGVVLAAGRGARLRPLSDGLPKPLAPVCNKPIIQYQLEAMRDAGVRDVAIVIGPNGGPIRARFGDGSGLGVRIEYVTDPAPAGIAASLLRAEPWVEGPFTLFLGDIMLALDDLAPAFEPLERGAAGSLVVRHDTPEAVRRNFVVVADETGRVSGVVEKPRGELPSDLKGCGAYVFDRAIFAAIRRTRPSPLRNELELTDSIQTLIDMGGPLYAAEVVRWDINVTYPVDLLDCNLRLLRDRGLGRLVGVGAWIHAGAELRRSIVGDGAIVGAPIVLDECVVLPGARVGDFGARRFRRHIFAPEAVWAAST